MQLFQCHESPRAGSGEARIETPEGALVTTAMVGSATLAGPQEAVRLVRGGRLFAWDHGDCRLELLRCPVSPAWLAGTLEGSEALEGCEAAVWRFLARADAACVSLRCVWETLPLAARGGPDSGQFLAAQTWQIGGRRVSLGTEDEASLALRAAEGIGLPTRLAPLLGPHAVAYEPLGLRVSLPKLRAGECGQLRFLVAWSTPRRADDAATWFAVGVLSIPRLLAQAGCQ